MRMTFDQVEKWFGEKLWFVSNTFRRCNQDPRDLYQELLIMCVSQEWQNKPTKCRYTGFLLPLDPSHVNRFVTSRALDLARFEDRQSNRVRVMPQVPERLTVKVDVPDSRFDKLVEILRKELTDTDFEIVMLKAFPDDRVLVEAVKVRSKALVSRAQGKLRMNVHGELKITGSHVSKALGISPATVSRAITKAKLALAPFGLKVA